MKVALYGKWMENVVRAFGMRGHRVVWLIPEGGMWRLAEDFDLLIAYPPCQYLCVSGLHWNTRRPERAARTEAALEDVRFLLERHHIPRIALENPVSCISSRIRKPDQIIQPYEFGHDASKKTCLWLKGLPLLQPTQRIEPRWVKGKPRWGNQFDSGQNNQINAEDRTRARAERWTGIANAMADQWGKLC
jgi:hypothetical protein